MVDASIAHKVVGYFSHSPRSGVFCDGDACIIAGTESLMYSYIQAMMISGDKTMQEKSMVVRKTKLGEILSGLAQGGAYAFDHGSYLKFFSLAKKYELDNFPEPEDFFSKQSPTGLHFIRIQLSGV
jgi:hypothetical protein